MSTHKQLQQRHTDRTHIGIRCPECDSFKIIRADELDGFISSKQERRLYRCLNCGKVFSIISRM